MFLAIRKERPQENPFVRLAKAASQANTATSKLEATALKWGEKWL